MPANEVGVRLRVRDARKFNSDMRKAGSNVRALGFATETAGTRARRSRKGLLSAAVGAGAISKAANVGALSLGAAGIAVLKLGSDFESKMAQVKAVSGATGAQFTALKDLAIEQGQATKFSASESADAMYELASAGVPPTRMAATLKGTLSLAAASGIDLASAAEIQANALGGFGLAGDKATHVADVLAQVTADSSVKMTDLQYSMKYIGPIAKATGQSFETMSAALGVMGNAGIKGEQAGTSIRGGLLRLVKPTKQVEAGFADMGAKASDFYGPKGLKPLPQIIDIIRKKTQGMTAAQRNQAVASVFGTEALSGMQALINAQPGTLEKLTKRYEGADGASKKMAKTMNDTVAGSFDQAKGSAETLAIEIFEFTSPALKGALLGIAHGANAIGVFIKDHKGEIKAGFAVVGDAITDVWDITKKLVDDLKPLGIVAGVTLVVAFNALAGALDWVNGNFDDIEGILGPLVAGFVLYKGVVWGTVVAERALVAIGIARTFIAAAAATDVFTASMIVLDGALAVNPVVAIAIAVIALGVAFYMAYTKVKPFHDAVNATFNFLWTHWPLLIPIVLALTGPLGVAVLAFFKFRDGATSAFNAVKGAVGSAVRWAVDRLREFLDFLGRVKDKIEDIPGVKQALDVGKFAVGHRPDVLVAKGVAKTAKGIAHTLGVPGAAAGGIVRRTGAVLVGEHGPELLNLNVGARVDPLPHASVPNAPTAVPHNKDDEALGDFDFNDALGIPPLHLYIDGKEVAVTVRKHAGNEKNRR